MKNFLLFAVTALSLSACAYLGLSPPKTFIESAVAAQLTATAVRTSATNLLNSGAISVADAKNAQAAASTANEGIDIAMKMYTAACPLLPQTEAVDPSCKAPAAEAKLTALVGILTVTQTYLQTKEKKP